MSGKSALISILEQQISKKKKSFSGFSYRWLAGQLGMSQSLLSQILSEKRSFPPEKLDLICKVLDIDPEKKEILAHELLKGQGWKSPPAKSIREANIAFPAHKKSWENAPIEDLALLQDRKNFLILEATQLTGYDGTAKFIAGRLGFSEAFVAERLEALKNKKYIHLSKGRWRKSATLLEFQSLLSKEHLVRIHTQAMDDAIRVMREEVSEEEISRRLITSCVFTCSEDQVHLLRAKIAEFMKEIVGGAEEQEPESVYQLAIHLFPATKPR